MRLQRALGRWGPPLAVLVLLLVGWEALSRFGLDAERRFLLPPPRQVVAVGLLDGANLLEALTALWATARVALVGLGIAAALGLGTAVLMSQARWLERSIYPWAVVLQTIPILALVPLIGFWFGFDFGSRVIVCVLIAVFPIITSSLFGLQSVDQGLRELFALHGAGRLTRLARLELPAALPAILTGLRTSAGLSVIGAIVGEFFFRQGFVGIGRLMDVYRAKLQTEQLFCAIFLSSLLGLALFWLFGLLGHLCLRRWHDSARPRP